VGSRGEVLTKTYNFSTDTLQFPAGVGHTGESRGVVAASAAPGAEVAMIEGHDFRFGPFRLDLQNERLWGEGEEIVLRPKSFAVLRYSLNLSHIWTHPPLQE
jgi:hypothetical protein